VRWQKKRKETQRKATYCTIAHPIVGTCGVIPQQMQDHEVAEEENNTEEKHLLTVVSLPPHRKMKNLLGTVKSNII